MGLGRKSPDIFLKRFSIPFLTVVLVAVLPACQTTGVSPDAGASEPTSRIAELQTRLGIEYLRQGKLELAYNRLTRALQADPDYSTAHNAMALVEERLKRPDRAEQHYRRALAANPGDSAAHNNYGLFLCRRERFEESEEQFTQAAGNPLYDQPEVAYANAGVCMKRAGNLDDAETYLRRALEINPKVPPALIAMSELSYEKGRYLPARAYLQRYLEVASHNAHSLWLGIRIERELGDKNTASSYALRLKANYPDSKETKLLLESGEL